MKSLHLVLLFVGLASGITVQYDPVTGFTPTSASVFAVTGELEGSINFTETLYEYSDAARCAFLLMPICAGTDPCVGYAQGTGFYTDCPADGSVTYTSILTTQQGCSLGHFFTLNLTCGDVQTLVNIKDVPIEWKDKYGANVTTTPTTVTERVSTTTPTTTSTTTSTTTTTPLGSFPREVEGGQVELCIVIGSVLGLFMLSLVYILIKNGCKDGEQRKVSSVPKGGDETMYFIAMQ